MAVTDSTTRRFSMDLIWIILQVFLAFAVAQNQTDIQVTLGQKVDLNCTVDIKGTAFSWYMEIHSGFKVCIVHIYGGGSDNQDCIEHIDSKYEVKGKTLVINKITAADCRRYFCGKMDDHKMQFLNSFNVFTSEYKLCYMFTFEFKGTFCESVGVSSTDAFGWRPAEPQNVSRVAP